MKLLTYSKVVIVLLSILYFSSCKTSKEIVYTRNYIKNNELYNYVSKNSIDFNELLIRNIKISYSNDQTQIRFSGVIKIQKDSSIFLAITAPLGIEIARVKINQDSIFVIDRKNKKYFNNDIKILEMFFKYPITFYEIQNILLNTNFKDFENLLTVKNNKRRLYINSKNCFELSKTEYLRNQYFKIDTINKQVNISNKFLEKEYFVSKNNSNIQIEYIDFYTIEDKFFPHNIIIKIYSDSNKSEIKLEYSKPIFRERKKLKFVIPNGYEKINNFL